MVEIQRELNLRGIEINERTVGKMYRQFLALLGGLSTPIYDRLAQTAAAHGGLIWTIDALQPEASGTLLYVLYEVLGGTVVSAIQLRGRSSEQMQAWLKPYQDLPFQVLATLSDGEDAIITALKQGWSKVPHQRCQAHFLSNLSEPALPYDFKLRQSLEADLKQLPPVPQVSQRQTTSPFCPS